MVHTHTHTLHSRELDHAMLRRLEKRILVDLPNAAARCAMFRHHLPQVLSHSPLTITTEIDYNLVAEVSSYVFDQLPPFNILIPEPYEIDACL